jgi:hypothetical protein
LVSRQSQERDEIGPNRSALRLQIDLRQSDREVDSLGDKAISQTNGRREQLPFLKQKLGGAEI